MKIVVWDDLPEGGAKRVVWEQIRGLSKTHRVDYITNTVDSQFDASKYTHRMWRFDMNLDEHRGIGRPLQELSYLTKVLPIYGQIASLITKLGPDIVLVHPSMITQAPYILTMIKERTVYYVEEWPRVVYESKFHSLPLGFHGLYESVRRQSLKWIDKKSAHAADRLITTSNYLKDHLSTIYDRTLELVPPGVDLNTFCISKNSDNSRDYFLFFGETEAISGFPLVKKVLHQGYRVKIVNFKEGGFRYSDKQVATLYQNAIATLCLAEEEPFGLTATESMACGTPVIAVNSGGYLDTVRHEETGLLIDPEEQQLVKAMRRLGVDKDLRTKMSKAGRKLMESKFSWQQHIDRLEKILKEVHET